MNTPHDSNRHPILFKITDVCLELNLGRTKVFQLIRAGKLRACYIGKALRVHRDEVDRFARSLQEGE